jgi:phosphoribosyl-AMP cyclohydrolase
MEISVRDASDAEALEILNEPSVRRLIQFDPIGIHPEWAVLMMDEKLLVLVQVNDDDIEIHVACRYRDRGSIRETMKKGIEWFVSKGFKIIWTTAPDSRKGLVKLLESLQFRKFGERWVYGY